MRLDFLGEQRVSERGETGAPSLAVGRRLEILAYLVVNAGMPQERERLAGLLWPDSTDSQARTNLRRELHGLRQLPGIQDCIHTDGTSVMWRDGPSCSSDIRNFHRDRALALRFARESNPAGLLRHGLAAIDSYKGELLPGLYAEWVLAERQVLHRQCVDLCDCVAAAAAAATPARALAVAQLRLRLEPLEETGYQTLMELQSAAGDTAAAVNTYHRCAAALEQELGVEPGPRTRELARVLLGFTPPRRPAGGRAVRIPGPGAAAPIGREREEAILRQRWKQAGTGVPGLMLLTGDAGVGKTRLLVSLLAAARAEDAVIASARCFAGAGRMALSPVAEWLDSGAFHPRTWSGGSPWAAELARLLPGVRTYIPPRVRGQGEGLTDAWKRREFYERLARAVVAPGRPTLLILDDLQWCDGETLDWMAVLFSRAPTAPLLVAAAARTDELAANSATDEAFAVLRTAQWVQKLEVTPLDVDSSAAVAASVLDRALSDSEAALLHAATGGYPLHVVETARGMGGASLAEVLADSAQGSRTGLGLLRRRFEQCSPQARAVASLAAAVGREFNLDLLARAWTEDEHSLVAAVDELWRRRILREQHGSYDFTHDLLRQCAYELESPPQRWLLHRSLAQALEAQHRGAEDTVAAQLAQQYRSAGEPDRAMGYFLRAGDGAARIFAHARALADYQAGLDLLSERAQDEDAPSRELEVLLRMPPSLTALHGYSSPPLRATLERIIELAADLGRSRILASAHIGLFAATFVQGHTMLSQALAVRALGLARTMPDLLGQANFAVGGAATSLGHTAEAITHFDMACAQAPDRHSYILGTRIEVHARAWSAHAHWLAGDDDGAVALAAEATDRANHAEHPYSLAVALAYRVVLMQMRMGCPDVSGTSAEDLARTAAELESLCTRYSFAYYGHWGSILRGWQIGGERGVTMMRTGIKELVATSAFARMPYWRYLLADALVGCDRGEDARAVLAAAESGAYQHDDLWWLPEILRRRALLADPAAARLLLGRAQALAGEQHSLMLAARIQLTAPNAGRTPSS